ncbi:glycosyltransferase family 4 protein [Amylibacter sp.]|jgi:glycosyltransferase involved in cell wall biosynthesis|nr:glycosyltransferase family 4 protein [Amylibacter sp.]
MKLAINGRTLEGRRTGVGRYQANLLNIWSAEENQNTYDLYFKNEIPKDEFLKNPNITTHLIPNPKYIDIGPLWENFYLPKGVRKNSNADIYFTANYTLPILPISTKKVVTIFDISYIAHPEWFPKRQLASLAPLTGPTVRKADVIITGSIATKNEILKYYDIDENKIKITNLGVDNTFLNLDKTKGKSEANRVTKKYNLKGKVILFVGLLMNRRNIPQLIEAVANVIKNTGEIITLVILGKNHTYPYQDIDALAAEFGMTEQLRWIEYTSDEDVFGLYKAANLFMCISLYEGFNITPLEALGLGVPTICSNLSSLPEVVGDAAYMLEDPTDSMQMAEAIEHVVFNDTLCNQLIEKGKIQASKFSWERCAKETMDILNEV